VLRELTPPLAIIFALAAAIAVAAYATQVSAGLPTPTEYAAYQNARFGFALAVPADMSVLETDADGGQQIEFNDPSYTKQFIVTATPYSQFDVTLQREGSASNTQDQPDHLEIVNVRHDDLFHVWFTKDGNLYTVVTMPALEAWLTAEILPTWQFTD
jgi:hypothetical protein